MSVPYGGTRQCSFVVPVGVLVTDITVRVYVGTSLVEDANLTAAAQGSLRLDNNENRVGVFSYSVAGHAAGTNFREMVTSNGNVFGPISKDATVGDMPTTTATTTQSTSYACTCGKLHG